MEITVYFHIERKNFHMIRHQIIYLHEKKWSNDGSYDFAILDDLLILTILPYCLA